MKTGDIRNYIVNIRNKLYEINGKAPEIAAEEYRHWILNHKNVRTESNKNLFQFALENNLENTIKTLLLCGVSKTIFRSKSPIQNSIAYYRPSPKLIELLLESGENVNIITKQSKESLLHLLLKNSNISPIDKREIVKILINKGINLNTNDSIFNKRTTDYRAMQKLFGSMNSKEPSCETPKVKAFIIYLSKLAVKDSEFHNIEKQVLLESEGEKSSSTEIPRIDHQSTISEEPILGYEDENGNILFCDGKAGDQTWEPIRTFSDKSSRDKEITSKVRCAAASTLGKRLSTEDKPEESLTKRAKSSNEDIISGSKDAKKRALLEVNKIYKKRKNNNFDSLIKKLKKPEDHPNNKQNDDEELETETPLYLPYDDADLQEAFNILESIGDSEEEDNGKALEVTTEESSTALSILGKRLSTEDKPEESLTKQAKCSNENIISGSKDAKKRALLGVNIIYKKRKNKNFDSLIKKLKKPEDHPNNNTNNEEEQETETPLYLPYDDADLQEAFNILESLGDSEKEDNGNALEVTTEESSTAPPVLGKRLSTEDKPEDHPSNKQNDNDEDDWETELLQSLAYNDNEITSSENNHEITNKPNIHQLVNIRAKLEEINWNAPEIAAEESRDWILEHKDIITKSNKNIFQIALEINLENTIKTLLLCGVRKIIFAGKSPIQNSIAYYTPSPKLIELLLESGENVNIITKQSKESLLHLLLKNSNISPIDKREIVKILINKGINLNTNDSIFNKRTTDYKAIQELFDNPYSRELSCETPKVKAFIIYLHKLAVKYSEFGDVGNQYLLVAEEDSLFNIAHDISDAERREQADFWREGHLTEPAAQIEEVGGEDILLGLATQLSFVGDSAYTSSRNQESQDIRAIRFSETEY